LFIENKKEENILQIEKIYRDISKEVVQLDD
jgi:hypothetical protein